MAYLSDVIGEEYKDWKSGFIFFSVGTGCGKTQFIINKLAPYAMEQGTNILLLVNRVLLKEQISEELTEKNLDIYIAQNEPFDTPEKIEDIERDPNTDSWSIYCDLCEKYERFVCCDGSFPFTNIEVMTYQQLESNLLKGIYPKNFHYIVCDEAHYFHSDSEFSNTSFISYNYIMKEKNKGKSKIILMSASAWILRDYLNKRNLIQHEYIMQPTYSHIRNFYVYDEKDKIKWITQILESDQNARILYFTNRRYVFREIVDSFQDKCCFLASDTSNTYTEFIDCVPLAQILMIDKNKITFNSDKQICISTSIMDNGVSIKDEQLNYIFCDFDNACTLIQALGRKRMLFEGDWCDVYIQYHNEISDIQKITTQFHIERMVYKRQFSQLKKYMIENKFIGDNRFFTTFPALYMLPLTAKIDVKQTVLRLHKRLIDDNQFIQENGFINFLALYLEVSVERITSLTHINDNLTGLMAYIENIPNKIILPEYKKRFLTDFSILCPSFKNKTPKKVNKFFENNNLPYKLISKQNASHEGQMYWEIETITVD